MYCTQCILVIPPPWDTSCVCAYDGVLVPTLDNEVHSLEVQLPTQYLDIESTTNIQY